MPHTNMNDPSLCQQARLLCIQVVTREMHAACTGEVSMSKASLYDILMAIESASCTGQVGNTPVTLEQYNRLHNESALQEYGCSSDRVLNNELLPPLGTLLARAVQAEWDNQNPVVGGVCVVCMESKATIGFLPSTSARL